MVDLQLLIYRITHLISNLHGHLKLQISFLMDEFKNVDLIDLCLQLVVEWLKI